MMNQVDFFKCLSDQTRLDLLMLVLKKTECCVCEFTEILALSQPKISRHLALLRSHKVLQDRRQGQWVYYRLHDQLPAWCLAVLTQTLQTHEGLRNLEIINYKTNTCCE